MALESRPLDTIDLESLRALDRIHTRRFGVEPLISAASLGYYRRSGHAFVAERDGTAVGFILGRALWDGQQAAVSAARVAVAEPGDVAVLTTLVDAFTKSAYDAGVYRLELRLDDDDATAIDAGLARGYRRAAHTILSRRLGSREAKETR